MMFTVDLPLPPSVNGMFVQSHRNSKFGKGMSPAYQAWRNGCKAIVISAYRKAGSPIIAKPYSVNIAVNINHSSDLDNRCKAVLDLLTKTLPIPGDQWINRIVLERDRTIEGARVEVVSLI